ncbi:hypothetical protein [Corynebacterium glyciniphilum]|uniref:hypothetical protein n=1 Tax=Corynebacterium glyciniphilum TaxID=1404244 RepID=UPI002650C510|nr:hypothetical protein [Corynebacterium glyciniphilum]MDN6707411.1 hypothetical protein [Corynebacterium glyciniphilum]
MDISTNRTLYRFRDGALDAISRSKNCRSESELAAILGIRDEQLDRVRHGALVGLPMAVHVAKLMGTDGYLGAWTELVTADPIAA